MLAWQGEPIILASGSATRRDMLQAAGVAFEVVTSAVDELAITAEREAAGDGPRAIALALATAKAEAVSAHYPDRWVLGGDSVVSVGARIYAKPSSRDDAADHLRCFSGQVLVLDSAAVLARAGVLADSVSDHAELSVRRLNEEFIVRYLDAEWPAIAACVGCFRMEGLGVHLFSEAAGSHFTILGMPLLGVLTMLRHQGIIQT